MSPKSSLGKDEIRPEYDLSGGVRGKFSLEQALLVAAARRSLHAPNAPVLSPVRSLHYFVPMIEELVATPLPDGYIEYISHKMKKIQAEHETALLTDRSRRQVPR